VRPTAVLDEKQRVLHVAHEAGDGELQLAIDAFGDGTRIPMLVVSPYSKGVGMVHSYTDHVSFDKFVEANWKLPPISAYSRDRLPNPASKPGAPYFPINSPAIGNLMNMFNFHATD